MNRRSFGKLASALALALSQMPSPGSAAAGDAVAVTMVTHGAGLGDQGYNDLANAGGERAASELGIDWQVIESRSPADYVPNVESGAQRSDLTIGVGFLMTDAIADVAPRFPERRFLLVDSVVEAPNVASVLFREQEAAFLAGIVAGTTTRTGRVGVVGGQLVPPIERGVAGFLAGVATIDPAITVTVAYADSFEDPAVGKELALVQFGAGADIVFAVAGKTGLGVYEAAAETGNGVSVIGSDVSPEGTPPDFQLCVVRKGIDSAVLLVIGQMVEGAFAAGTRELGLAEGGVSLETPGNTLPADLMDLVTRYANRIASGAIIIPASERESEDVATGTPLATTD